MAIETYAEYNRLTQKLAREVLSLHRYIRQARDRDFKELQKLANLAKAKPENWHPERLQASREMRLFDYFRLISAEYYQNLDRLLAVRLRIKAIINRTDIEKAPNDPFRTFDANEKEALNKLLAKLDTTIQELDAEFKAFNGIKVPHLDTAPLFKEIEQLVEAHLERVQPASELQTHLRDQGYQPPELPNPLHMAITPLSGQGLNDIQRLLAQAEQRSREYTNAMQAALDAQSPHIKGLKDALDLLRTIVQRETQKARKAHRRQQRRSTISEGNEESPLMDPSEQTITLKPPYAAMQQYLTDFDEYMRQVAQRLQLTEFMAHENTYASKHARGTVVNFISKYEVPLTLALGIFVLAGLSIGGYYADSPFVRFQRHLGSAALNDAAIFQPIIGTNSSREHGEHLREIALVAEAGMYSGGICFNIMFIIAALAAVRFLIWAISGTTSLFSPPKHAQAHAEVMLTQEERDFFSQSPGYTWSTLGIETQEDWDRLLEDFNRPRPLQAPPPHQRQRAEDDGKELTVALAEPVNLRDLPPTLAGFLISTRRSYEEDDENASLHSADLDSLPSAEPMRP